MAASRTEGAGPRVLVVGDVMLDRYLFGDVTRISPEAPVPVLRTLREDLRPGGAANVAANVAAMGVPCTLLSVAGADPAREALAAALARHDVRAEIIAWPGGATTQKTRLVAGAQQIVRFDHDAPVPVEACAWLEARFAELLPQADIVILSDYAKGCLAGIAGLLRRAREAGVRTLVDPKAAPAAKYAGAFLLKPNKREFRLLFGEAPDRAAITRRGHAAVRELGLRHLVVTLGADGMLLVGAEGEEVHVPTVAQEVFDVSGAGDTVIAALGVALARGRDMRGAVVEANLAANIAVSHAGTYVVTAADMRRHTGDVAAPKVSEAGELARHLAPERRDGRRVVFTNGCFDILHPGHVRMLQAARRLGDVLVVGLNEDASVARLKGPARPINRFEDRAEVLAGLAAVDFVVGFGEDTPLRLIEQLQPDVLVKGGDYDPASIVGADVVQARGGRVVALDFYEGHSSTRIIARMAGEGAADGG